MRAKPIVLSLLLIAVVMPGTKERTVGAAGEPVAKIAVTRTGRISINGEATTIDKLRGQLADLRRANGVVWYYREAGDPQPPAEAMAVIKLVIEQRLPISMSSKPDYSDVVMPDGTARPRGGSRRCLSR